MNCTKVNPCMVVVFIATSKSKPLNLFSATQVSLKGDNKETQCCFPKTPMIEKETQCTQPKEDMYLSESQSSLNTSTTSDIDDDGYAPVAEYKNDTDYLPESEESNDEEIEPEEMLHASRYQERKYIVFESCLLQLFTLCHVCLAPATIDKKSRRGTMLTIRSTCLEGHSRVWKSQPEHNNMPWGNFLVAAAILFSGSQP